MEQEVDLRPYIEHLIRRWPWIIGSAFVAALVSFGLTLLIPPTFEATALVAVTEPRQSIQFDPRFETIELSVRRQGSYPELATSDELVAELWHRVSSSVENPGSLDELRNMLAATSVTDASLVHLTARHREPVVAAEIVNVWAELFLIRANELYGNTGGEHLRFFEEQLAHMEAELTTAEQALIDFQLRNRSTIIGNQLLSLELAQSNYLTEQRALVSLDSEIEGLRDQISQQSAAIPVSFADQLTALSLQVKAYNVEMDSPFQLQLNGAESLGSSDRADQIAYLDGLLAVLQTRSSQIETRLAEIEPRILVLQGQKQTIDTEFARLERDHGVASETYIALARKVEEERITSQGSISGMRMASRAAVPANPVGTGKVRNATLGGAIGFLLSVFVITIFGWWRMVEPRPDEEERASEVQRAHANI